MKNRYNYFYKITNNINGKYYYGVHSTTDLNDGYMGSGKVLRRAQKRYGIEHFTKEILRYFDTEEEMYAYEREMVDMERVRDINCYNVALGGSGGNVFAGYTEGEMHDLGVKISESLKGRKHTEEELRKMSEANKGRTFSEEARRKMSESHQGKKHTEEELRKMSESHQGKKHTEETRRKISESHKGERNGVYGKHWRLDPETNKRVYY